MLICLTLLALASPQSGSTVFAVDPVAGTLFRAESNSFPGTLTAIGSAGVNIEAIEFDADSRHLWAASRGASGEVAFGTLDLETAAHSIRATAAIPGPVTDIASAPDRGTWYVAESVGSNSVVWSGHLPSGSLSPWVTVVGSGPLTGLTVELDGRVVACRAADGALIEVTASGASALGSLPQGAPLPFGLEANWASGELLATVDRMAPRLVSLDPTSGAETLLAQLGAGSPLLRLAVRRSARDLVTDVLCAPAVPNATGVAARLGARGSAQLEHNDLVLTAGSMPTNSFGLFLFSLEMASPVVPPGAVGRLCLGGTVGRLAAAGQLLSTGASGEFALPVDLGSLPQGGASIAVTSAEDLYFQAWYRDSLGGTATSNFTAAARVDVAPRVSGELYAPRGLPTEFAFRPLAVDLDGDGDKEVLIASTGITLQLFWNEGGRLVRRDRLEPGTSALYFLQSGDMDGDGDPDLVVSGGSEVRVGWNEGGEIVEWTSAASCWSVTGLEVVDLDGDGREDLAYHCSPHDRVRVTYSEAGRTFTPAVVVPFVDAPQHILGGDLDADGYADLVQVTAGRVELRRGAPGRSFEPGVFLPSVSPSLIPSLLDFDQDGDLDIVLAPGSGSEIHWLRNDGGAWGVGPGASLGVLSIGVDFGDLDGDGLLDVAAIQQTPRRPRLLRGDGAGSFVAFATPVVGSDPSVLLAADLDGDVRSEVLVSDRDAGYVSVLRGDHSAHSTNTQVFDAPVAFSGAREAILRPGDIDGDGDQDLVVPTTTPLGPMHALLRNRGDGTFAPYESILPPRGAADLEIVDVNGDGFLDLLQIDAGRPWMHTLFGDGSGSFQTSPTLILPTNLNPGSLAVGDVDGDGNVDALVTQYGFMVLLGDGQGGFAPIGTVPDTNGTFWNDVDLSDVDGDGALDAVGRSGLGVSVAWGDGAGGFATPALVAAGFRGHALADYDGDGRLDVLGLGSSSSSQPDGEVALQRQGRSFEVRPFQVSGRPRGVRGGDLDGDGTTDLVFFHSDTHSLDHTYWLGLALNDGFAEFGQESWFLGRPDLDGLLLQDLDGDRYPEIAVFDTEDRQVIVLGGGER